MRLKLAEHYGLRFQMRKETGVYNPALSDSAIKTLYRLKRALKKPMTEIAESLIQQSLKTFDKGVVCEICIAEKNNQCDECYMKGGL